MVHRWLIHTLTVECVIHLLLLQTSFNISMLANFYLHCKLLILLCQFVGPNSMENQIRYQCGLVAFVFAMYWPESNKCNESFHITKWISENRKHFIVSGFFFTIFAIYKSVCNLLNHENSSVAQSNVWYSTQK